MMSPKRIQRKRIKGWRKPEGAVIVGRPARYLGNPFIVTPARSRRDGPLDMWAVQYFGTTLVRFDLKHAAAADAVDRYRLWINEQPPHVRKQIRADLAGRDLVCWCPLDQPCHADVLLEIANGGDPS